MERSTVMTSSGRHCWEQCTAIYYLCLLWITLTKRGKSITILMQECFRHHACRSRPQRHAKYGSLLVKGLKTYAYKSFNIYLIHFYFFRTIMCWGAFIICLRFCPSHEDVFFKLFFYLVARMICCFCFWLECNGL